MSESLGLFPSFQSSNGDIITTTVYNFGSPWEHTFDAGSDFKSAFLIVVNDNTDAVFMPGIFSIVKDVSMPTQLSLIRYNKSRKEISNAGYISFDSTSMTLELDYTTVCTFVVVTSAA